MLRIKTTIARKKRHKKILKSVRGFSGARSKHFRKANESLMHKLEHQTLSRKLIKRDMRTLWTKRIYAFAKCNDTSYVTILKKAKEHQMDKKTLSNFLFTFDRKLVFKNGDFFLHVE